MLVRGLQIFWMTLKRSKEPFKLFPLIKTRGFAASLKKITTLSRWLFAEMHLIFLLKEKSVDIIHSSLFLHHLEENQSNAILEHFSKIAKYGIVINDLRRSLRALIGIKFLTLLFSRSELVRNDAPLSVRKGFSKSELVKLMTKTAFSNYEIIRKWAFRWIVIIRIKS